MPQPPYQKLSKLETIWRLAVCKWQQQQNGSCRSGLARHWERDGQKHFTAQGATSPCLKKFRDKSLSSSWHSPDGSSSGSSLIDLETN